MFLPHAYKCPVICLNVFRFAGQFFLSFFFSFGGRFTASHKHCKPKITFCNFTTVIDMNIVNLGIKVIIFLKKYSVCIEYILGTVIMLETNSHPPTGAVLLLPTFSDDKNC